MSSYFDTSALVPLYLPERCSIEARRQAVAAGPLPYTPLHGVELTNAIHLNHGRGNITAGDVRAVTVQIEEDVAAQRLRTTAIDLADVFRNATRLAREHSARVLCRSLDVLHVAVALSLRCQRLVTADDRQRALARAVGLDVVDVKRRRRARP